MNADSAVLFEVEEGCEEGETMLVKQQVHGLLRVELFLLTPLLIGLGCFQAEARLGRTDLLIFVLQQLNQPTCSPGFVNTCLGFMGA